ncbi:MAG: acyltransferase [Cohaesibacter sp.]|nr:acyltransferase [Cohaesibacter sp.]MCV6602656.1 acyltransferase [Cohaesibacter sp.]
MSPKTNSNIWVPTNNNFDLIRLLLASLVIVSHSYPLFAGSDDPWQAYGSLHNIGQLCVMAFFVVSGLLVTRSATRSRSLLSYAISRVYRLIPGAFVCALWMVFFLGLAFTTLSLGDYLLNGRIWSFLGRNTLLMSIQYDLPGVFKDNVYAGAVNGSLWSLKIEIKMYLIFGLLVFGLRLLPRLLPYLKHILLVFALVLLAQIYIPGMFFSFDPGGKGLSLWGYGYYFAAGAVLFAWSDLIARNLSVALALALGTAFLVHTPFYDFALRLSLPYLVYCFAFSQIAVLRKSRGLPDISYGIYIYGFPVQQGLSALYAQSLGFWTLTALSLLITVLLAIFSWYAIEHPSLTRKRQGEELILAQVRKFKAKILPQS